MFGGEEGRDAYMFCSQRGFVKHDRLECGRRTAKRTPAGRSRLPAATRAVRVPMNPWPARSDVPAGRIVDEPEISCQIQQDECWYHEHT